MPKKPLSKRKRKYIKGLTEGKTKKQSALEAGYAKSTAENAKALIETVDVREEFQKSIRAKIPLAKIVERLAEGLDAEETKFFQKDGKVTMSENVIAWGERRAYLELATEYGGYFVPRQELAVDDLTNADDRIREFFTRASARAAKVSKSPGA